MAHTMTRRMRKHGSAAFKHMGNGHARFSKPWAAAGMVAAFTGGALIGAMGFKKAAMRQEGMAGKGWMYGHHHHAFGSPACGMKHEPVAPGAIDEEYGERSEGE